jgi:glycine dehydrogenase
MVCDLTGMSMSNASLLDEATAAAEAMSMAYNLKNQKKKKIFIDQGCHPQNIALVQTRAEPLGIEVIVGDVKNAQSQFDTGDFFGAIVQYPNTYGEIGDWSKFNHDAQSAGVLTIACTDLMASVLLKPAGEQGFDIAVGVSQRFGVPMGFGGPHAAFLATTMEYSRKMPGRIIGVSIDAEGNSALRMAMQTREQHIRRDKATSNICTAQALLANMAGMYGTYHGPEGLKKIATRIHDMTRATAKVLSNKGYTIKNSDGAFFDTISVSVEDAQATANAAASAGVNIRVVDDTTVSISFGEAIGHDDTVAMLSAFGCSEDDLNAVIGDMNNIPSAIPTHIARETSFMDHPVFNSYHSETQMMR